MTDKTYIESVRQSTETLIACGDDFALMKRVAVFQREIDKAMR